MGGVGYRKVFESCVKPENKQTRRELLRAGRRKMRSLGKVVTEKQKLEVGDPGQASASRMSDKAAPEKESSFKKE